jgi:hypothetical protein
MAALQVIWMGEIDVYLKWAETFLVTGCENPTCVREQLLRVHCEATVAVSSVWRWIGWIKNRKSWTSWQDSYKTVTASNQQSWPHTITMYFELLVPLKNGLWGQNYADDETLKNVVFQQLQRNDSNFTGWEHVFLFKGGRRLVTKIRSIWKNNYAFRNFVINLMYAMQSAWYKKNRQHYFLNNPHMLQNTYHTLIFMKDGDNCEVHKCSKLLKSYPFRKLC